MANRGGGRSSREWEVMSYWAVAMTNFHVAGSSHMTNFCGPDSNFDGHCTAIVDSGTTFLAIAMGQFHRVMQMVLAGKDCTFKPSMQQYSCQGGDSDIDSFPTLRFAFAPHAKFDVKPREYVQDMRKFGQGLVPRLRNHATRNGLEFWVFGDFFLRKYYTVFDHGFLRLGFSCAKGQEQACAGSADW